MQGSRRADGAGVAGGNVVLHLGLVVGVMAVSFASILIRLTDAPPLTVASYRMGIASLTVVTATLVRRQGWPGFGRRDLGLGLLSGAFLALHFGAWITSLDYTTVASSVVLVTASPLLVAVASRIFLREPLRRRTLMGIGLGLAGGLVIASGDLQVSGRALLGDALAFLGAVAITGYLLVGRHLRRRVPVLPYLSLVYTASAVMLVSWAVALGSPLYGFPGGTYLMLVLVALVPQVVGHSLLNWTLFRVSATLVSVSVMAEPVVSTVLALLVLKEWPGVPTLVGGVIILSGIYVAMRPPRTGPVPATAKEV